MQYAVTNSSLGTSSNFFTYSFQSIFCIKRSDQLSSVYAYLAASRHFYVIILSFPSSGHHHLLVLHSIHLLSLINCGIRMRNMSVELSIQFYHPASRQHWADKIIFVPILFATAIALLHFPISIGNIR